jgi:ABC-type branched-subunit amino acid transport system substrate-binding protein
VKRRTILGLSALVVALGLLSAACGGNDKKSSSSSSGTSGGSADFVKLGGWDDGPCKSSDPKVAVEVVTPIEAPGTSLKDYADGAQAAVDAFNKRGGVKGQCLDLKICDSKFDGPTEVACARDEVGNQNIVAGLASTFVTREADAYHLFEAAGLSQVGAQVTMPQAWNSPVAFEFTMGGSGALLSAIPALKNIGVTKFAVFVPESGQSGALKTFAAPLIKAENMDMVDIIEIPATAVEFTQFVKRAEGAGAQGAILGLPGNTASQIIDGMNQVNSQLKLAGAFGTFSQKTVSDLPSAIAKNMAFSDAVPPVANTEPGRWPINNVMLDDFQASGKPNLTKESETSQATNGWLSTYAFIKVMRDSGASKITRQTVKQAFDKAKDVPMFGLIPQWTPSKTSNNLIFSGISNSNYWTGRWDPSQKLFIVDPKQVDILALLG